MLAACGRARRAQARAWFSGAGFGCRAQNKGRGPGGRRKQHLVLLGEAALLHDHGVEEELLEGPLKHLPAQGALVPQGDAQGGRGAAADCLCTLALCVESPVDDGARASTFSSTLDSVMKR